MEDGHVSDPAMIILEDDWSAEAHSRVAVLARQPRLTSVSRAWVCCASLGPFTGRSF